MDYYNTEIHRYYTEREYSINCNFEDYEAISKQMQKQKSDDEILILTFYFNPIESTAKIKDKVRLPAYEELIMNFKYNTIFN